MTSKDVFFSTGIEYEEMTDDSLINLIKKEDKTALNFLINRYKDTVEIKVCKYFINGAEKEDLVQEGLIGLFKAIKNYDCEKQNSFKSFANLCIERQIITAVKGSRRQKHLPLNSYVSLNNSNMENENGEMESQLIDVLNSRVIEDPLDTIMKYEYYREVEKKIDKTLCDFEKQVLNSYVQGKSYNEIAESLNMPVKSIDNAIQRIRRKTSKNIENLT
ncbi:MAG: RNA polymerase sporulation sigma factor SigH [Clostridia bacterium]|nr:RNA polymerase sporulation sigma factor SigH [Clostridia bacterium]